MDGAQILLILKSRLRLIMSTVLLFGLAALLISLILPPRYVASASVVIDSSGMNPTTGQSSGPSEVSRDTIRATQLDIATSQRVARRVVTDLALDKDPTYLEDWADATEKRSGQGDLVDWVAEKLIKRADIIFGKESNVLEIHYKSSNPTFAADAANAFATAYLQTTIDLRTDSARRSADFFDARVKNLGEELEQARAELSSFEQENKVASSDERLDVDMAQLNVLAAQYAQMQVLAADTSSRRSLVSRNANASSDVNLNPVVQATRQELALQRAKLTELAATLGPAHPTYVATRDRVDALQASLDSAASVSAATVSGNSIVDAGRLAQVRNALEQQRAKVLANKEVRGRLEILQRKVENAQRTYDLVLTRYSQTSLESQSVLNTAVLLTPAVVPLVPVAPRMALNVPLGCIVGLLVGICVALLQEQVEPRFRRDADIARVLGVPLLARVPSALTTHRPILLGTRTRAAVPRLSA